MPLTSFQRRKLDRMFDTLDINRDGVVSRADFERRVEAAARRNGWTEDSEAYRRSQRAALDQWDTLIETADADGDQTVTREEFQRAAEIFLDDREAVRSFARGDAQLLFDAMDADGDGRISAEEYRAWLEICGVDSSYADAFFAHADLDENGRLTRREMAHAMEEFLLSEDPSAGGNFLFGPIEEA